LDALYVDLLEAAVPRQGAVELEVGDVLAERIGLRPELAGRMEDGET
jgi:hypothetical protein